MNTRARGRKLQRGISEITDAIADVLEEEGGLDAVTIAQRCGFSASSPVWGEYDIVRSVLRIMSDSGEAVNEQPGSGPGSWRLKETCPQDQSD